MMEPWKKEAIRARNAAVILVACPECRASAGQGCVSWRGNPARRPCMGRIKASPAAVQAVQDVLAKYRTPIPPTAEEVVP